MCVGGGAVATIKATLSHLHLFVQVQLQMYVCQAAYADFVTWTPNQTVIFRVPRDDDFIVGAVDTISRFWARHIYPQLVGTSAPEIEVKQLWLKHYSEYKLQYMSVHMFYI